MQQELVPAGIGMFFSIAVGIVYKTNGWHL
jgi:hypothetical protein